MIGRTFAGLILGLLFSMSLALNLNLTLPFNIDTSLFFGLIIAFPLWVAVQVWCYATDSTKEAWKRGAKILVPSVALNILLLSLR